MPPPTADEPFACGMARSSTEDRLNSRWPAIRKYDGSRSREPWPAPKVQTQLGRAAVQIFAANDRMNQLIIERLDPSVWGAKPPGKVRSIAAVFTHIHNVRTKWIRLTAPHLKVPSQLNRCTARRSRLVRDWPRALLVARRCWPKRWAVGGRVEKFYRDGWAKPWPAGPEMLCYMLSHEAHHRGQVCMLAHQLGFPSAQRR